MTGEHSPMTRLTTKLTALRADMLHLEEESTAALGGVAPAYADSARNLLHYVALRRHDVRPLQERLAELGLSSLGRAEGCVLATIDAVLERLANRPLDSADSSELDLPRGQALLAEHTQALLGPRPAQRGVRIMVTMPGEAATDYAQVRDLVASGMDCMRINCAHDGPDAWGRMIGHLRRAQQELDKPCRVLMDLGGPRASCN